MMQWLLFSLSSIEAAVEIRSPNTTASGNSQWEVALPSLGHQLHSNLVWYPGLHVHCNSAAIGFDKSAAKLFGGYLQIPTLHTSQ